MKTFTCSSLIVADLSIFSVTDDNGISHWVLPDTIGHKLIHLAAPEGETETYLGLLEGTEEALAHLQSLDLTWEDVTEDQEFGDCYTGTVTIEKVGDSWVVSRLQSSTFMLLNEDRIVDTEEVEKEEV